MQPAIFAGLACAFVVAGCGTDRNGQTPQPANAVQGGNSAADDPSRGENQDSANSETETRELGPLAIRYDPDRLAAVEASFEVPPDWDRQVSGLQLIAADRLSLMGREECQYGQAGMDLECTPASEGGIGFATLEESYDRARERMAGENSRPVMLAGRDGIAWSIGVEGERTEYTLLPAGNRTVMVVHRTRNRENPDPSAIAQAKESLRIEG